MKAKWDVFRVYGLRRPDQGGGGWIALDRPYTSLESARAHAVYRRRSENWLWLALIVRDKRGRQVTNRI